LKANISAVVFVLPTRHKDVKCLKTPSPKMAFWTTMAESWMHAALWGCAFE